MKKEDKHETNRKEERKKDNKGIACVTNLLFPTAYKVQLKVMCSSPTT